ncbi:hypothetical protein [Microbacterium sp. SORGH_AS_0888]|uniref:hypothetical protein n=1 Tax=Microbacterium sp. SORGH_AS_0888 TaxID=3041791 RepID=UPI0027862D37|nr:hypothetical protein [Microbacterium sp. SORGH_AS_0888]MDQ1127952.1 hypothetical protein [Microbacterium sp. SORGH_AS_0888]
MHMDLDLPVDVVRRYERLDPIDGRRLKRAIESGEWVRIAAGVFVPGDQWRALLPIERHRVRVLEAMRRLTRPTTFVLFAAAAFWRMDVLGPWPTQVDVAAAGSRGGRATGSIRRHAVSPDALAVIAAGGHSVTTPAQTATDIARALPHLRGVTAIDQALWVGRPGGPLTTRRELELALDRGPARRGHVRARLSVAAGEDGAANVRETQARVEIIRLGFPRPRLQERRLLRSGRLVFGDMYFPDADHWLEVDGDGKYLSPEFTHGRAPERIVLDEKARENEIRREVRGFSRLGARDADHPRTLYDILALDGLRSALPRP